MRRGNIGLAIVALLAFAGYATWVLVVSISSGDGQGSGYWASIAAILLLIAFALWIAVYLFRGRFSKGS